MKVVTVSIWIALLVCCLILVVNAETIGVQAVQEGRSKNTLIRPRAQQAGLGCPAGDQCCQYSASVSECSSTESTSKGCRSRIQCVSREDPCTVATNSSSCLAASGLCRFNNEFGTCTLDTLLDPCSSITDLDECTTSTSCKVNHECLHSCTHCPECLEATRTFAQLPAMLRTLQATGGDHEQFFKGFCLSTAMAIDPSMQAEILSGCEQIITDAARSPGLLQRPGALCARLGMCHTGCSAAATSSSSNSSSSVRGATEVDTTTSTSTTVSLCSPTGWSMNADATTAATGSLMDETASGGAVSNRYCLTSDDCAGDLACDTFSQPQCHSSCDEHTGMDRCVAAGMCVDYCQRPDIKMAVQDSRRRFRACSAAADCSSGEQCVVPDFSCKVLTCSNAAAAASGGDPVQVVACTTICLPEKPRMMTARFSDDGHSIQVLLNQEAAPVEALCAYIFDEQTSQLLGSMSRCTTNGNILTVWLAGDVMIRPGQHTLTISSRNGLLASVLGVNSVTGAPVFAGGLENVTNVQNCVNCSQSGLPVVLTGPAEVSLPCGGAPGNIPHSTSASNPSSRWTSSPHQPSGFTFTAMIPADKLWMVKDVEWAVVDDQSNVTSLQQLLESVNSKPYAWDRQSLFIPTEALPSIPETTFTLSVTATNIFNITSTSNFTFTKRNSSQAPAFELEKSLTHFYPSQGFRVMAKRLPSNCRMSGTGTEVWKWSTDIPGIRLDGVQSTRLVFPPRDLVGNVEIGKDYHITLKAYYSGSDATAIDTLILRAVGSPLEARLSGPSGTVPMLQGNITFDASGSRDPDDPDDAMTEATYLWSCHDTVDMSPCFGMQQDATTWALDPSTLSANQSYTVSVTVAKGSRNATTSTTIKPMTQPTPSCRITRFCGLQTERASTPGIDSQIETDQDPSMYLPAELGATFADLGMGWSSLASGTYQQPYRKPTAKPCPAKHNPTDPLTLVITPDSAYTNAEFTWWLDPASKPGVRLSESNTMAGVNGNTVTILPGALPAGGSVTVRVNMSLPGQEGTSSTGSSSITVPLNTLPYCSSAPISTCTVLNTTTGTFPTARFHAWATGWADTDQDNLKYEFGVLSDDLGPQVLASGDSNTYTFTHLLPGNSTLYVCAIDSFGARACERTVVTVRRPQNSWDVHTLEDKILSFDLGDVDGMSKKPDEEIVPTSVVDAALQMASLLTYSVTDVINSVGGFLGFLQDASSSGDRGVPVLAYKPSVQNATNKVLVALARSGHGVDDTDELDSLLTAAAQLGKVTRTNTRGGRALLNLFKRTMQAHRKEQKLLSSQRLNTYTDALTTGLAAAVSPSSARTARQAAVTRPLQAASATKRHKHRGKSATAAANDASAAPAAKQRSLLAVPAAGSGDSPSIQKTKESPRSVKFQTPASPFTARQAYQFVLSGVRRLNLAQDLTLNAPAVPVGNEGVCGASALLQQRNVSGFTISFECPGMADPAEVMLPESFASTCSNNSVCLNSSPFLVSSQYYSPDGSLASIILGVVESGDNMIQKDGRLLETEVVSGVLNVTLNYTTAEGTFCPLRRSVPNTTAAAAATGANPADRSLLVDPESLADGPASSSTSSSVSAVTTANSSSTTSPPCLVTLKFPIDPKLYDASKNLECVYLAPKGYNLRSLQATASYPVTDTVQEAAVLPRTAAAAAAGAANYMFAGSPGAEDSAPAAPAEATPQTSADAGASQAASNAKLIQPAAVTASQGVLYAECQVPRQGLYVVVQWPAHSYPDIPDFTSNSVPGAFTEAPVQSMNAASPNTASHPADRTQTSASKVPADAAAAAAPQQAGLASVKFTFTFQVGYQELIADAAVLDNFRTQLQQTVLTGVAGTWTDGPSLADPDGALQLQYVTVNGFRPSSVMIDDQAISGPYTDVDVWFMPPQGSSSSQLDKLAALSPAELISSNSRLHAMLVTAHVVGSSFERRSMNAAVIAGSVVGGVVALAAAVGLVFVIGHRCRRRSSARGVRSSRSSGSGGGNAADDGDEGSRDIRRCNSGAETPIGDISYTWSDSDSKKQGSNNRSGHFSPRRVRENPLHDGTKPLMPDQVVHHNYVFYCADELLTGNSRMQTPTAMADDVDGHDDTAVGDEGANAEQAMDEQGAASDGIMGSRASSTGQQQQEGLRQPAAL